MRTQLSIALLCLLSTSACITTTSGSTRTHSAPASEWIEPSPSLQQKIEANARRLPWTHGVKETAELISWFAEVGEPAYPTLLNLVLDPRPEVAGAALAALGMTRDSRLVDHLNGLPWPSEQEAGLALERARALLMLGDWSMAPHLINGLRDESVYRRALCIRALEQATHQRFDYVAGASEEDRAASITKWDAWWYERSKDTLLKR